MSEQPPYVVSATYQRPNRSAEWAQGPWWTHHGLQSGRSCRTLLSLD